MDSTHDSLSTILNQVAGTTISINNHADGHFISKAQLAALRSNVNVILTPEDSEADDLESDLNDSLVFHTAQLRKLDRKIKLEIEPAKRAKLNVDIILESIDWDITLMPGSALRMYWCFHTENRPAVPHDYLARPIGGVFVGSEGASTSCQASLPPNHAFGRELKALNLGNKPPRFHFRVVGASASSEVVAVVRAVANVSFYGRGLITANAIQPIALTISERT